MVTKSGEPVTQDPFTAEIMRSFLVSTVREMVGTTTRTAISTCFCHGEDFTCGLFDRPGRMIAQAQGIGVHAGALEDALAAVRARYPNPVAGDVYLHNDPFDGGTHQADVCVLRPIFDGERHLGYAVNRGHWSDVGGMAPGGWSGAAEDSVQEGLVLPAVCLYRAGELERDLAEMLLRNVRMRRQCWGDLQAQIASSIAAERRIQALVGRYGRDAFEVAGEAALEYGRRRMLAALAGFPDGVGEAVDMLEDDGRGNGPFSIRVRLTKTADRVTADFTGTDPQAAAPINCTLACTKAGVLGPVVAVLDPDLPLNAGVTDCVTVHAPEGSLVNPTAPAPVFGSTADPVDRVMETVMGALRELAPERAVAGSYSTGQNVTGGGMTADGDDFLWYSYQAGGCGAWQGGDGNAAEWHLMANSKNESMEAWEARYPVEFVGFSLLPDSGGAGRWRGGLGTERSFRLLESTRLSAIADHHLTGAVGIDGGGDGLPNGFFVIRDGVRRSLQETAGLTSPSKFANVPLRAGDVFVTRQGGGGGWGEARRRDRKAVRDDLRDGYVSTDAALELYGWDDASEEVG